MNGHFVRVSAVLHTLPPCVRSRVVIRAPNKGSCKGFLSRLPVSRIARVSHPSLPGGVVAERNTAVGNFGNPVVAVNVKVKVCAAFFISNDGSICAAKLVPREPLECKALIKRRLVVQKRG